MRFGNFEVFFLKRHSVADGAKERIARETSGEMTDVSHCRNSSLRYFLRYLLSIHNFREIWDFSPKSNPNSRVKAVLGSISTRSSILIFNQQKWLSSINVWSIQYLQLDQIFFFLSLSFPAGNKTHAWNINRALNTTSRHFYLFMNPLLRKLEFSTPDLRRELFSGINILHIGGKRMWGK